MFKSLECECFLLSQSLTEKQNGFTLYCKRGKAIISKWVPKSDTDQNITGTVYLASTYLCNIVELFLDLRLFLSLSHNCSAHNSCKNCFQFNDTFIKIYRTHTLTKSATNYILHTILAKVGIGPTHKVKVISVKKPIQNVFDLVLNSSNKLQTLICHLSHKKKIIRNEPVLQKPQMLSMNHSKLFPLTAQSRRYSKQINFK